MVANHPEMLGCHAVWHYLETGHGKGPCDGVGGSLKRNAQTAASAGVAIVRNAPTMYLWAKDRPNSSIQFCYVDVYNYWTAYYERSHVFYRIPALPGTRKLHSMMGGINNKYVHYRETTCSCDTCRHGTPNEACGWTKFEFIKAKSLLYSTVCDNCLSPLCVCLGRVASLRKQYMEQHKILKVPGKLMAQLHINLT